jgi:hypothetical protein
VEFHREIAGIARSFRNYSLEKPPSVSEMIDFANALQLLGADHVTEEQRDVLLPFLAKTEKDRRHLLLREGFQSLLGRWGALCAGSRLHAGGARYEMASCASSACSAGWLGTGEHCSCRELRSALRQPLRRACGVGCRVDRCRVALESTSRVQQGRSGVDAVDARNGAALWRISALRPEQNIAAGTRYVTTLMWEFHGDLRLVAAAYYAGDRWVGKRQLDYSNPDVIAYVESVRRHYLARKSLQIHFSRR